MKPTRFSSLIPKAAAPLIWRTAAFLVLFVLYSGIIGPPIISGGILTEAGFGAYGPLGKTLLFSAIAFLILWWRNQKPLTLRRWSFRNLYWIFISGLLFVVAYMGMERLLSGELTPFWIATTHATLLASVVLALAGCFGPANLRSVVRVYARELALAALAGLGFFLLLTAIYSLWTVLALMVLHAVKFLLGISGIDVGVIEPRTLIMDRFGVTIEQYCSGIESLALFTGLFAVITMVDWKRFNRRNLAVAYVVGMIGLFIFNILRVFVLVLGGYYINPEIALSLFHTYAGMVFFIIYFALFWGLASKRIYAKQ